MNKPAIKSAPEQTAEPSVVPAVTINIPMPAGAAVPCQAIDKRKDFAQRLERRFEALLPHPSHCACNQQTQREHVQFCAGWYWETAIRIVKKELAECEAAT